MELSHLAPKLEQIGKITAVIASFGVIVSVSYDWGFLSALGLGFADAPTSLSDHVRSWLVWLPTVVIAVIVILFLELFNRRVEKGLSEEEILRRSRNPEWLRRMRRSPRVAIGILGITIVGLWLLFGERFSPGLVLGLIVCWFLFTRWVFGHPTVRDRYSEEFRFLVDWVPPIMIFFYFLGFAAANTKIGHAGPLGVLHVKSSAGTLDKLQVGVVRSYESWILVKDEKKRVVWIRSNEITQIENPALESGWGGLLCSLSERFCLSMGRPHQKQP